MSEILDSGQRREFDTGAVRDMSAGKGRCDLMPLAEIATTFNDVIICEIASFTQTQSVVYLHNAIRIFVSVYYPSEEDAMLDLAKHYENGLKKYPENNWKKGIPVSSFIDSGVRHYYKARRGDDDENHRAAFLWNMYGCIWTVLHDGGIVADCTGSDREDKENAAVSEKVHRKTYLEDFIEKYPNAPVVPDGLPTACRAPIYGGHCQRNPCINCEDCWRELMPEEGCT